MYKDVAKRVLAVILTFCMIGTMPDTALLAQAVSAENVNAEINEAEISAAADDLEELVSEDSKMPAPVETETERKTGESLAPITDQQQNISVTAADVPTAREGEGISLEDSIISKPETIPNQISTNIPAVGEFVEAEIVGLDMYNTQTNTKLKQRRVNSEAAEGDYIVTVVSKSEFKATIRIEGVGGYTSFLTREITLGKDIQHESINITAIRNGEEVPVNGSEPVEYTYIGEKIDFNITIKDSTIMGGSQTLTEGVHYRITLPEEEGSLINAGSGTVIIEGIGSGDAGALTYAGKREVNFKINPAPLSSIYTLQLDGNDPDIPYNKKAAETPEGILPELKVVNIKTKAIVYESGETETVPDDFRFIANNNKSYTGEEATIGLIAGNSGNCTSSGTVSQRSFRITQADVQGLEAKVDHTYTYTGKKIEPGLNDIKIIQDGMALDSSDFEIIGYGDNLSKKGTVTIRGKGNYTGTRTLEFTIADFNLADIPDANIENSIVKRVKYTGSPIVQEGLGNNLTVDGNTFFEGTDYDVVYENNTGAGDAAVVFKARAGSNCTGEKRYSFVIYKDITEDGDSLNVSVGNQIYTGKAIRPKPDIVDDAGKVWAKPLTENVHYEIEYDPNDDYTQVTTHSFTIKAIGEYYEGEMTVSFEIQQRSMDSITAEFKIPGSENSVFTGSAIEPEVIVYGTDGNGGRVELPKGDFQFEYKLVGSNDGCTPVNAGEYRIEIKPADSNGNYIYNNVPKILFFQINQKELKYDIGRYTIELDSYEFTYSGSEIDPGVRIRDLERNEVLVKDTDYTYELRNHINAGTATVVINGINNYYSNNPITRTFTIKKKDISEATSVTITLDPDEEYVYTGETVVPVISKLVIDGGEWDADSVYDDFNIRSTAINAGTGYTFTIEGKGNYIGSISSADHGSVTFDIARKDIGDALNVRVKDIANQEYTGSPVEPELVITYNGQTLVKGTDYTTASINNTNKYPGTDEDAPVPTVTITGIINFTGERDMTFRICDSIREAVVTGLDDYQCTYTSLPCEPKPGSVMLDGEQLLENIDYIIEYEDNIESNYRNGNKRTDYDKQPKVLIVGTGKYGGTKAIDFRINSAMLTGSNASQLDATRFVVSVGGNPVFTGSPVKPALTVSYKTGVKDPETGKEILYQLTSPEDYRVNPINDVNVGTTKYNLQIAGFGNFFSLNWITIRQYQISCKPITSASIEVRGLDTIDVSARPVSISGITIVDTQRNADGTYVKEGGTYPLTSNDCTITATGLDRPGTAKIKITGKGNYNSSREISIDIPGSLQDAEIEFTDSNNADKSIGEYLFTGFKITPKIKVTCGVDENGDKIELKTTDYDYAVIGASIDHGTYQIVLTGKGAYEGTSKTDGSFRILQRPLSDSAVKMSVAASVDYDDGKNVWPIPTLMLGKYQLREGIDYRLIPQEDCRVPTILSGSKYTLIIQAIDGGNFTGAKDHRYTIGAKLNVNIYFEREADQESTYTGKSIEPKLLVYDPEASGNPLLTEGVDYALSYSDNVNVGTVTITVSGLGDPDITDRKQYYGTKSVTFSIVAKKLSDSDIQIAPIAPITYTGSPIMPEPTVTWKGNVDENGDDILLEAGVDFQYKYTSNTDAGEGKVTISPATGNKNFDGSQEISFTIKPKNLEDDDVVIEGVPDQVYIGRAIEPELNIHWGEDSFHEVTVPLANMSATRPTGYTVTKFNGEDDGGNVEIGAVEMTIEGKGNYTGTRVVPFNIVKVDLDKVRVEYSTEEQYTGKQITPPVSLKYDSTDGKIRDVEMTPEGWGYIVTYGSNERLGTRAGKITVTANSDGNCEGGPLELAFDIVPRHITDVKTVEILFSGQPEPEPQYYNSSEGPCELDIDITFVCDGYIYHLIKGEDYNVDYSGNDRVGTATVTITGMKNFDDKVDKSFQIYKRLSDYLEINSVTDTSLVYNGTKQKPTLDLEYINEVLSEGTDYKIVYGDEDDPDGCVNAGTHPGKIVGDGDYGGELEFEYTIRPRNISNVTFAIEDQEYTGSDIIPPVTGMDEGIEMELQPEDFTIAQAVSNKEIGTAVVTVAAAVNSNYTGTKTAEFRIVPADIEKEYMNISDIDELWAYTGNEIEPEIVLEDTRRNSEGEAILARAGEFYVLGNGTDYDITYDNDHIYPDEVTMTITGKSHYTGTVEKHFRITARLEDAVIDPIQAQPYTGEAVEPELTVRLGDKLLVLGEDYEVSYSNNINRSTEDSPASATITAAEGSLYTGSKTANFMISRDIAGADLLLIAESFIYTGTQIRPMVSVSFGGDLLVDGVDYEVKDYVNNIDVGTASIVIRGIGGYDGETTAEFSIIPRSIVRCDFNNIVEKVYAGRATSQDIVVSDEGRQLQQNVDYTLTYTDNANPGIATIEVSGINNYGGIATIRYLINVSNMTTVRAQGYTNYVQLSWSAVPGAQGYAVYDLNNKLIARTTALSYTHSNLDAVTTYSYKVRAYIVVNGTTYYGGFSSAVQATTSIAQPSVTLKANKKKILVSWQRINGVTGYEIYRSSKKAKGYKLIRTASRVSITSYTNKGLKRKTRYYYRIRAYKTVNGRKVYSSYSSPKSVKTK